MFVSEQNDKFETPALATRSKKSAVSVKPTNHFALPPHSLIIKGRPFTRPKNYFQTHPGEL